MTIYHYPPRITTCTYRHCHLCYTRPPSPPPPPPLLTPAPPFTQCTAVTIICHPYPPPTHHTVSHLHQILHEAVDHRQTCRRLAVLARTLFPLFGKASCKKVLNHVDQDSCRSQTCDDINDQKHACFRFLFARIRVGPPRSFPPFPRLAPFPARSFAICSCF